MVNDEQSLEQRMRQDDKTALDFIYREYRDGFINYALRFELDREDLEDIFQDSIIAMYQKFAVKQTVLKSSSIKTYLYGIGKNMIYNRFKNQVTRSEIIDDRFEDTQEMESHEPNLKQKLLAKHFKDLSPSCQKILNLFYYRGWSINEIVMGTEYKDENTVKSHKSRCLKGLKEKIVTD